MTAPAKMQRRWPRRLGLALLALAVLVGVVLGWLNSEWGGESVRKRVVEAANAQLSGRLEVEGLRLFGDHLTLRGLKLFTPEGELVAEVEELDATVELSALAAGKVRVKQLRLTGVSADLSRDDRGLKLARAVAPKEVKPVVESAKKASALDVSVEAFKLERVRLHALEPARPADDPLREVAFELGGEGALQLRGPPNQLTAKLALTGRTVKPLEDPLALAVKTSGPLDALAGELKLQLGEERLETSFDLGKKEARIATLEVTPRWVGTLAPQAKLKSKVALHGLVSTTRVNLDGEAAGGVHLDAELSGVGGEAPPTVPRFELALTKLRPAELLEEGPEATVDAAFSGALTEADLAQASGSLRGGARVESSAGVASLELDAQVTKGTLMLRPLRLVVPGAAVVVMGAANARMLALDGAVQANDLAQAANYGAALGGQPSPGIAGRGALAIHVEGSPQHPQLDLDGNFPRLAAGSAVLEGVEAKVGVPDVRRPREAHAQLQVAAATVGEQRIEHFGADVQVAGNTLDGKLTAEALEQVSLAFGGELSPTRDALDLATLSLEYPGTQWVLASPAHLEWGPNHWHVEPLALTAGPQRIELAGERKKGQLDAQLKVSHFDLGKLPQVAKKRAAPEGTVDVTVAAKGEASAPAVDFTAAWRDGKLGDLDGLSFDADGRFAKGRVAAKVKLASGKLGAVDGQVDAAVKWREQQSAVELQLESLDVGALLDALKRPRTVEGRAAGQVKFEGTLDAPKATVTLDASALDVCPAPACVEGGPRLKLTGLRVAGTAETGAPLKLTAGVSLLGGVVEFDAASHATLAQLADQKDAGERTAPVEANLKVAGLQLAGLQEAGFTESPIEQRLALEAHLTGTAEHPDLEATLDATGTTPAAGAAPGAPAEEAAVRPLQLVSHLELRTTRQHTGLRGYAKLGANSLLKLEGGVTAPLEALPTATTAPVVVDADLGPLEVGSLIPRGPLNRAPPEMGSVAGHLHLAGTAEKPTGTFQGQLKDLHFQKVNLGRVALQWDYDEAKHAAKVRWESPKGGELDLAATARLDLGVESLKRGLKPAQAPFTAELDAEHFDLSAGSGLSTTVRTLGGLLDAKVKAEGHLDAPHVQGRLEWTRGKLGSSYGDYREARLSAEVDENRLKLNRFFAKAGEGELEVTGEVKRNGDGFDLLADVRADNLPVVTDDQLFALLTTQVHAEGGKSGAATEIALHLPETHVELPQVKRKDLQDLERPKDIVLVRGGTKPQAKKKEEKKETSLEAVKQRAERFTLVVDAPKNLWVKGTDLNLELGLSDGFQVELSRGAELFGEARVLKGRIDVIGRRFDVEKNSAVRFQGPPATPYVNLTATHHNEREGVVVFVTVVGKGKELALKTSSQPPLSDNDIFTLLATGRRTLKRGSGSSISGEQAASVLGALAASQLKTMVAKKLPLDVLSIDAGAEGLERARVEAGTYLSDQLYLGYQLQLGADKTKGENQHAVRLEYQLGRNWTVEGGAGDAPAASADVMWSRDY